MSAESSRVVNGTEVAEPVRVADGVDAVRDGERCGAQQVRAAAQRVQNERVGLRVDGRCRLVEHENSARAKNRSGQTELLSLSLREIAPALRERAVQSALCTPLIHAAHRAHAEQLARPRRADARQERELPDTLGQ